MATARELKARVIELALEEARTHAAYVKAYKEEKQPYGEPLFPVVLAACTANLAALHALESVGRALYAEMQKPKAQRGASKAQLEYRAKMLAPVSP